MLLGRSVGGRKPFRRPTEMLDELVDPGRAEGGGRRAAGQEVAPGQSHVQVLGSMRTSPATSRSRFSTTRRYVNGLATCSLTA